MLLHTEAHDGGQGLQGRVRILRHAPGAQGAVAAAAVEEVVAYELKPKYPVRVAQTEGFGGPVGGGEDGSLVGIGGARGQQSARRVEGHVVDTAVLIL